MAKWIMIAGALLLVTGAVLHFFPSLFSWFGKLPGDIHHESENGSVFIPITSMIIVSIVLSVLFNVFKH
jgi:H+/Cl- antiporter ClcA